MDKSPSLFHIRGRGCILDVYSDEVGRVSIGVKFDAPEAKGDVLLEEGPYGLGILDASGERSYGLIDMYHNSPAAPEDNQRPELQIIIDTETDPAAYARFYKDGRVVVEVDAYGADEVELPDPRKSHSYNFTWDWVKEGKDAGTIGELPT